MRKKINFANMITGLLCLAKRVLQKIRDRVEVEEKTLKAGNSEADFDRDMRFEAEWPYNNHWLW